MEKTVTHRLEGKVGVITLNRPKAINALNGEMIDGVAAALAAFTANDGVEAVVLAGEGARGFCAGGDVREVTAQAAAGDYAGLEGFFAREYQLNCAISQSAKPIIALTQGVVMGGGIGLAGHAQIRIATADAKFAMPEAAIGLFCDVGVDALLVDVPLPRALAFLLTGLVVGARDAQALNLTDHVVATDALAVILDTVCAEVGTRPLDDIITDIMAGHGADAAAPVFCDEADAAPFAGGSAGEIVMALDAMSAGNPAAARFNEILASRCPTSLELIYACQIKARELGDIGAILDLHLRAAKFMGRRGDFIEGVRAVLIDKDKDPKWQPARLAAVDHAQIKAVVC